MSYGTGATGFTGPCDPKSFVAPPWRAATVGRPPGFLFQGSSSEERSPTSWMISHITNGYK